jgi:WD repeat-containing protein 23
VSYPFPNAYSHHLPNFSYNRETLEISVVFASDPSFPAGGKPSDAWRAKSYILASVPMLRARTIIDDASSFVSTALTTSLSFLSGSKSPKSSPEDVFDGEIDLSDGQVLEQDRGEEGEVDDSTAPARDVRVLTLASREKTLGEQAMLRRQWKVESLRSIAAAHRAHGRRSSS